MTVADFLVESILNDGLVVGANGNIDVPLGTVFTELALTRVDGTPPELVSVELGAVASVRLTVREVENKFFRKPLQVIPRGHTAGLRLDGEGMERVREALRIKQPREYVSMRATLPDGKATVS
jgi:hypothetical protein